MKSVEEYAEAAENVHHDDPVVYGLFAIARAIQDLNEEVKKGNRVPKTGPK